jgi:hypothetical protein
MVSPMVAEIALCAAGGFVVGALGGFALALLQLWAKRWRNARLARRGEPPIRDCVLVRWHIPCATLGAVASGALATAIPAQHAIAFGALAVPAALSLVMIGVATYQAVLTGARGAQGR